MTGVSVLSDNAHRLQKQALVFLINALSLEKDERVQGAILDVLAELPTGRSSPEALNEGLRVTVERNRSLTRSILDGWHSRVFKQRKEILAKFDIAGLDLNSIGKHIPEQVLSALSIEQHLSLLDAERGPFDPPLDPETGVPLVGLARAIPILVAHGAIWDDFRNIYCEDCQFSVGKSLDGAVFDDAHLARANFAHVSLRKAHFRNTDISFTNFFDADLTEGDLRIDILRGWEGYLMPPELECAKLGGADLSGRPLVYFEQSFNAESGDTPRYKIQLPSMTSARLDQSTKLDAFSIIMLITITDDYAKLHEATPEVERLTATPRFGWAKVGNPLTNGGEVAAVLRRASGYFDIDSKKYTSITIATAQWMFRAKDLNRLARRVHVALVHRSTNIENTATVF